ncbi:hypothetical protein BH23BAC1_BH23BAC1_16380 [soil metagenome]
MNKQKKHIQIVFTLAGLVAGVCYSVFSDNQIKPIPYINGISIGLIIGYLVSILEVYFFAPKEQHFSFLSKVALKTVSYVLLSGIVIIGVKGFNESIYFGQGFWDYVKGARFQNFLYNEDFEIIMIYTLMLMGITIFIKELSRKLGQGILLNFITGRYHKPREEERIFMFLDIKNSTSLAEKMGISTYFKMLNNFFFDVTSQIVLSGGIIYRYVGDQVVFTWKVQDKLKNTNCIKGYFNAKKQMQHLQPIYLEKYGEYPEFRASIHCGKVIVGEIGDVKSQIVFLGEPMYVTAKIEKKCGELGENILLSAEFADKIVLPDYYLLYPAGQLEVEFIDQPLNLFSIREQELELEIA